MELKAGARVTCTIFGTKIKNAKLQFEDGKWYICQNERDGNNCKDKLGYEYSWRFNKDEPLNDLVENLHLLDSTSIDGIYVGAKVSKEKGKIQEVLGICGRVIFLSRENNFDVVGDILHYTLEELKELDYRIIPEQPEEEAVEVTMKEVCEKFGKNVKIKKGEE